MKELFGSIIASTITFVYITLVMLVITIPVTSIVILFVNYKESFTTYIPEYIATILLIVQFIFFILFVKTNSLVSKFVGVKKGIK